MSNLELICARDGCDNSFRPTSDEWRFCGPVCRAAQWKVDKVTVTTKDHETGESETMDLSPNNYIVVCGAERYVASEQVHSNGTVVLTIKATEL